MSRQPAAQHRSDDEECARIVRDATRSRCSSRRGGGDRGEGTGGLSQSGPGLRQTWRLKAGGCRCWPPPLRY